jgi:hypothetical protein
LSAVCLPSFMAVYAASFSALRASWYVM